jgi:hypothetical protein
MDECRRLLVTMLDAVYVDAKGSRSIVAIKPKPPFRPIFQVATTKEGSGGRITNGPPASDTEGPTCFWWRRGRVESGLKHGPVFFIAADAPAPEASLILSAVA